MNDLRNAIKEIVNEYLYMISSRANHNHFRQKPHNGVKEMAQGIGFNMLYEDRDNYYVVLEELFLEGCTRVFLVNPIIKYLLDNHNIQNEWQYNDTFSNFTISNREYEHGAFLEFIAVLDGKKTGVRYTKTSYTSREFAIMDRDSGYYSGKEIVPGFERLSPVDTVIVIDWSGTEPSTTYAKYEKNRMTLKEFFEKYLSVDEYEVVVSEAIDAIRKAKKIIALQAIPQLLPNNMFSFKQTVLAEFSREKMSTIDYEFKDEDSIAGLNETDKAIIENAFFDSGYCNSIIGKEEFARSYITSEYLFRSIKDGLSIDYTSVVVGYLKSVEQLLYILYLSAFEGKTRLKYWDKCNREKSFDISQTEKYRYDPYALKEGENKMQEFYSHKKRTGSMAPEIGGLINLLRYYDKVWSISEDGKEYVIKCLNDYRQYCRNNHFHKDNIDSKNYKTVSIIRSNTQVCLYYLLGAFRLLDKSVEITDQLGIVDYRFELLYYSLQTHRRFYKAVYSDKSEAILYYLKEAANVEFDESGNLKSGDFKFLMIEKNGEICVEENENSILEDEECLRKNTVVISRKNYPMQITPIRGNKKWSELLAYK